MANNDFAESVINGTYKKNKQKENNTSQSNNDFAESVINGTYKKQKTVSTSREQQTTPRTTQSIRDAIISLTGVKDRQVSTTPPVQVTTQPVQVTPQEQTPSKPTTPLVYEGVNLNPNAPENERLRLIADNNYNQKEKALEQATSNYNNARNAELANRGIDADTLNRVENYNNLSLDEKLRKPTYEEGEKIAENARKYVEQKDEINNAIKNESSDLSNARNQMKYAKYLENVADVANEGVTLYDQTIGHLVRGAQDMFSTWTDDNQYIDENGNTVYLPTYNQMKEEQARNNTLLGNIGLDGLGKFLGDVGYQGAKIGTSMAMNTVLPGSGTAVYFTDVYADSYRDNINNGMDNEGAMVNAFAKAGQNYIKQWLLGGFGGKLAKVTGKDVSSLEKVFSKQWAKVATNPKVVAALSSMSAEAVDEFTDTYIEKAIDAATRSDVNIGDVFSLDTLLESLYSGAVGGATGAIGGVFNRNSRAAAQNAINQRIANQNAQQNIDNQIQAETPQIQQNTPENINNQPTLEQTQLELNEANNEPIRGIVENIENNNRNTNNNSQEEQNLINEINNEQRKLDNGNSEDDGFHLAELQKELQEVQQKSIANDSNAFNLGKIDENNTLRSIRTKEDISNRKTNAYQYDNPEVKPYFKDAALDLRDALENYTTKGERWEQADGTWTGTKFSSTPEITKLKDQYNMSYKDLDRGIEGIIKDKGAENNAASKKVELVIDDMLRNGYKSIDPNTSNPNQNYLDTLSGNFDASTIELEPTDEIPFPHTMQDEIDMGLREPINNQNANQQQEQQTVQQPIEQEQQVQEQPVTQEQPTQNDNIPERKTDEVIKLTPQQEEQHFVDSGVDKKVAKILSEMPKPDKVSLSEKIKNGKATLREEWSQFKRAFVDKGETIYNLGKKLKNKVLYPMYDKIGTTRGEANFSIEKGQTDLNGKKFNNFTDKNGKKVSMSLNQIWDGVDPGIANQYLAHWLNIDRYNQVTQDGQQKYVFGTPDINPEISRARIAELEAEHPELKRFGENVWQYGRNMLQNMVDGGLISEQQAQEFMQETPHYVRLQRNVDTNNQSALEIDKNGKIAVNKPTKNEFKGSDIDILPFKNSMADYTFEVAKAIRTNIFAQELGKAMSVSSTDDNVTSLDDSFGIRPDLLQDNGDGTYSLTLFNNGVATIIPINQGIYESLTPNKHYKFENTLPFKGIRKIDKIRKALLTEKNPMFLATNAFKDFFDAPLNSKYPVSFYKNYMRAIKEVSSNGKYYQQYQALGGLQNTYFENGEFKKDGSKLNPLNWIERGNNAIEQLPRLAEFISTMEKTGDINQAMYNAAEITTNFKRGGDVAKAANRNGATFLNASIQGFDKQVRNFTDVFSKVDGKVNIDKKQAVKLLGKIVALGLAPALINDMIYGDDEEYENMQDYIKDRYYLIKGFDGQWIRIPKGRAVSVFQSAARRTGEAMDGKDDAFKGFLEFAETQVAPNNPLENNILSPIVDVARNKSWSGSKIVSDYMAKRPEAEQWNEKTDEFSKWLGGVLNVSPMKINYLIDQYSGAVGDILLPMYTAKATSATENQWLKPITDKFTTDAVYSDKNVSAFYDMEKEYETKKYSMNATNEDRVKYNYLSSQGSKISDLRKEQSRIQSDSSLSKSEKYEQAREIQKQINELSKKAVEEIENYEDNKYYATIGDYVYYLDADGTFKKDAYADSHQKSADKKGMALYDYYKEQYEKRKEKSEK